MGNGGSRPIGAGDRANAAVRNLARAVGYNANGNMAEENSDGAVDNGNATNVTIDATNPINTISTHQNANSSGNDVVVIDVDDAAVDNGNATNVTMHATNPINSINAISTHQNANSAGNDVVIIDVDDTYAEPDIPGSTFELDEVQKGIVYSLAVHHIGGKDNFEILRRLCRKDKQLLETGVKLAKEDHLLIKFRQEFIIFFENYITTNAHAANELPHGVRVRNASLWTDDSTVCNGSDDDSTDDDSTEDDSSAEQPPPEKKRRPMHNHGNTAHVTSNTNASDTDSSEDRRLRPFYRSDGSDGSDRL